VSALKCSIFNRFLMCIFDTDIGTEELAHMEMISAIVYQLTRNLTPEQIKEGGFDAYFIDHTTGIYPQFASGTPWSAMTFQSKGDPITDLFEDMAAEQKARTTYDNLLRLIDDPDVREPLKFLREREIVHFQRFGDALRVVQDNLDAKNYYAFNPAFDTQSAGRRSPTMPSGSEKQPFSSQMQPPQMNG
ncbi:MAG: manganese catalase family protein, partial [Agathobaculum sp.]|uniref:manganese catalase family protein n=1 Tax=Agathobaculum sp. TaxID=2048138 RepID=UPI003D94FFC9